MFQSGAMDDAEVFAPPARAWARSNAPGRFEPYARVAFDDGWDSVRPKP